MGPRAAVRLAAVSAAASGAAAAWIPDGLAPAAAALGLVGHLPLRVPASLGTLSLQGQQDTEPLEPSKAPWWVVLPVDLLTGALLLVAAYYTYRRIEKRRGGDGAMAPSQSVAATFCGVTSAYGMVLLVSYVAVSTFHAFLQSNVGSSYSKVSATVLIYILKLVLALSMFVGKGESLREGLVSLRAWVPLPWPGSLRQIPAFVAPALPGALLGFYDATSFLVLTSLDPATYNIVGRMRAVFIGFFWQFIFRRSVSRSQWAALSLYMFASMAQEIDRYSQLGKASLFPFFLNLMQTLVGGVATVASEKVLKDLGVHTDLVNATLYSWGLLTLIVFQTIYDRDVLAVWKETFSANAWHNLFSDGYMVASIGCLSVFGLLTAYFLKEFSSIAKEMCGAAVIVIAALVEWMGGMTGFTAQSAFAVLAASVATLLYALDPLKAQPAQPAAGAREPPLREAAAGAGAGAELELQDQGEGGRGRGPRLEPGGSFEAPGQESPADSQA